MKDYRKSLLIQWAGFVPVLFLLFVTFGFFFKPVYISPIPLLVWNIVLVGSVLVMIVPFFHPRVRHYWNAVSEFDKTYRYEK